jgi:hypothetical protein
MPTLLDLQIVEAYSRLRSAHLAALECEVTTGRVKHRYFRTVKWFQDTLRT